MKTLKTFTILTLVASLTLGPVGYAAAQSFCPPFGGRCVPIDIPRPPSFPVIPPQDPGNGNDPVPPPPPSTPPIPDHDHGPSWGAVLGGTMLGVVMSSAANRSDQAGQPTVVVIQQPADDKTAEELALEIERERARVRALELEIARLKAELQEDAQDDESVPE